jgi:hypothetical protein
VVRSLDHALIAAAYSPQRNGTFTVLAPALLRAVMRMGVQFWS